jgi:hypothetical protein
LEDPLNGQGREEQPVEYHVLNSEEKRKKEERIKAVKTEIETKTKVLNDKILKFIWEFEEVKYQHQQCNLFQMKKKKELDQKMQALCDDMTNFRIPIEKELELSKNQLKDLEQQI